MPVESSIPNDCIQCGSRNGVFYVSDVVIIASTQFTPRCLIVAAPRTTLVIIVFVILGTAIDPALLKLRWHRAVGVTEAIPNIDIGAVTAGYRVSATAIHGPRISPGSLILWSEITVRVAEPVTGAEIQTSPTRRPLHRAPVPPFNA